MKELKDFQVEAINRKVAFGLVIVAALVAVAGLGLVARFGDIAFWNSKAENRKVVSHKKMTVSGSLTCLALKSGEKTSDCQWGIKDSKGQIYAISDSSSKLTNVYGEAGSTGVEISGEFIPAGDGEKYDITGTIVR